MKTSCFRNLILLLALLPVCTSLAQVHKDPRVNKIITSLNDYRQRFPQQKAFVFTDRIHYSAGQTLWFSCWLTEAFTLTPDSLSNVLYVELADNSGKAQLMQRVKLKNGRGHGEFVLPDTLDEGIYQLRAFSRWMLNFDHELVFSTYISINNASPLYFSKNEYKAHKAAERKHERLSARGFLTFFPEGGQCVSGFEQYLAFAAKDQNGDPIDVKGSVFDRKGNKVADFDSYYKGRGKLLFAPQSGEKYTAKAYFSNGYVEQFELPPALETGIVMQTGAPQNNLLPVKVRTNRPPTADEYNNDIFLLVFSGGKIAWMERADLNENEVTFNVPTELLKTGIAHLTLFDGQGRPVNQRLCYIDHKDQMHIDLKTDRANYPKRHPVTISLSAMSGEATPASLALTVHKFVEQPVDLPDAHITEALCLVSDVGRESASGSALFNLPDHDLQQALDLLMLTAVWRRFAWDKILDNQTLTPEVDITDNLAIRGRTTGYFFNIPAKGVFINISMLSTYNDAFQVQTDEKGLFCLENLEYFDTMRVEMTAYRLNGKRNVLILVEDDPTARIAFTLPPFLSNAILATKGKYSPENALAYASQDSFPQSETFTVHGEPDYRLKLTEQMVAGQHDLLQVLNGRVPGMAVYGNKANIRGSSSFYLPTEPLLLIDGMPTDFDAIHSINPLDVDYVEVLKGSSAAIYGSRGANGVIAVYTKRGFNIERGVLRFVMQGYHKCAEFVQPDFGSDILPQAEHYDPPTLYWKPEITTDANGQARLRFYSPDAAGTYEVIVKGLSINGKPGESKITFTVD